MRKFWNILEFIDRLFTKGVLRPATHVKLHPSGKFKDKQKYRTQQIINNGETIKLEEEKHTE